MSSVVNVLTASRAIKPERCLELDSYVAFWLALFMVTLYVNTVANLCIDIPCISVSL
jgi:hypothetical protein